jgi:hypothetical protein
VLAVIGAPELFWVVTFARTDPLAGELSTSKLFSRLQALGTDLFLQGAFGASKGKWMPLGGNGSSLQT